VKKNARLGAVILSITRREMDDLCAAEAFLSAVPHSSELYEFVCRPQKAQNIPNAATDDDARCTIVPAKYHCTRRDNQRAHNRIHKKNFLLVRAQVIRLRKNHYVRKHRNQQHHDRRRV